MQGLGYTKQKQSFVDVLQIGIPKYFANFTGKQLCSSLLYFFVEAVLAMESV